MNLKSDSEFERGDFERGGKSPPMVTSLRITTHSVLEI